FLNDDDRSRTDLWRMPLPLTSCPSTFRCADSALPTGNVVGADARRRRARSGSGKWKIVEIASIFGNRASSRGYATGVREEETAKRVTAGLLSGDSIVTLDNAAAPIGGSFFAKPLPNPRSVFGSWGP